MDCEVDGSQEGVFLIGAHDEFEFGIDTQFEGVLPQYAGAHPMDGGNPGAIYFQGVFEAADRAEHSAEPAFQFGRSFVREGDDERLIDAFECGFDSVFGVAD